MLRIRRYLFILFFPGSSFLFPASLGFLVCKLLLLGLFFGMHIIFCFISFYSHSLTAESFHQCFSDTPEFDLALNLATGMRGLLILIRSLLLSLFKECFSLLELPVRRQWLLFSADCRLGQSLVIELPKVIHYCF